MSLNHNGEKFVINGVKANGVFRDNVRELAVAMKYSIGKLKKSRYQNRILMKTETGYVKPLSFHTMKPTRFLLRQKLPHVPLLLISPGAGKERNTTVRRNPCR